MTNFDETSYLVVKISNLVDEKYIGCKCIPARWAENPFSNNYLIIQYPEAENSETRLLVQNKEPPKPIWPFYSALVMLRTESYEKALEFIAENDTEILPTSDELPDNNMNKTVPSTPSTSLKHRKSGDCTANEDNLPKKKRESALRSENNLKRLIKNGQVETNKQKVSPKKVLSLRKEVRTETLATLISAGKFDKLDKLFIKTVSAASHGPTENIETSDSETETLPTLDRNILEPITSNLAKPTRTRSVPNNTNASNTIGVSNQTNTANVPNSTFKPNKPTRALHCVNNPKLLKIPLSDSDDTSSIQISSTNNLGQNKGIETDSYGSRSSLDSNCLALHNLIRGLAPTKCGNKTQYHSTVDIEQIKDIYKTVLEVKSKLNAVYKEKSTKLRKCFESIQLFVPELKRGLSLPTIQELREKSRQTEEPKILASRKEQPSQRKYPSSQVSLPSSEPAESCSQLPEHSTPFPKCSYVAKWTLKHKGPGSGLIELLPNSDIYVEGSEFVRSKLRAKDVKHLARLVFPLIFSKEAIKKCSYTGNGPYGRRPKSTDALPALDEHARNVLEAFVNKHAKESGWPIVSPKLINETLSTKIRMQRNYYKSIKRYAEQGGKVPQTSIKKGGPSD